MSHLEDYAKRELELAGLYGDDADYGQLLPDSVMELVKTFAQQGHSGHSAEVTLSILERLLRFRPLTPLSPDPDEWHQVGPDMWQSLRDPAAFSNNGGATWYYVDDRKENS